MGLPHFLCIGVQKSGSTWLSEMLRQNPSLWLPPIKEIHFFDRLDNSPAEIARRQRNFRKKLSKPFFAKVIGGDQQARQQYIDTIVTTPTNTIEWYSGIFDAPTATGKLCGEVTPSYFDMTEAEIASLARTLPSVKLVLVIRDPVQRALSQLRMMIHRKRHKETGPEVEARLAIQMLRKRGRFANYRRQIPLWEKYFPADQLLFLPFGLIRDEPRRLLDQVERFIGAAHVPEYRSTERMQHKGKPIPISNDVQATFEDRLKLQRDFLVSRFGQEFYDATR